MCFRSGRENYDLILMLKNKVDFNQTRLRSLALTGLTSLVMTGLRSLDLTRLRSLVLMRLRSLVEVLVSS
jgi:hypothetical protein